MTELANGDPELDGAAGAAPEGFEGNHVLAQLRPLAEQELPAPELPPTRNSSTPIEFNGPLQRKQVSRSTFSCSLIVRNYT